MSCISVLLIIGCGPNQEITYLPNELSENYHHFHDLDVPSKLVLSKSEEVGERLNLCLTFVNKENEVPISNQKVHFYHTNVDGEYFPADIDDESTARLNGWATTNENGQVFIQTILPGDYGSSENNRHIHTSVTGAQPEAYDIHFDQYTGLMGLKFVNGSDQHFLAKLYSHRDTLVSFVTIEVKKPKLK